MPERKPVPRFALTRIIPRSRNRGCLAVDIVGDKRKTKAVLLFSTEADARQFLEENGLTGWSVEGLDRQLLFQWLVAAFERQGAELVLADARGSESPRLTVAFATFDLVMALENHVPSDGEIMAEFFFTVF